MVIIKPSEAFSCHEIANRLYQGSDPPKGLFLKEAGFDVLVLAAESLCANYTEEDYPGVEVILAPGVDNDAYVAAADSMITWQKTAPIINDLLDNGKKVIICCFAGLNRSGCLTAMVLHELFNWDGEKCVRRVQDKRNGALMNKSFVRWLKENIKKKG